MNIFFVLESLYTLGKGGTERVAISLANEMLRRGHKITICGHRLNKMSKVPCYTADPALNLVNVDLGKSLELERKIQKVAPDLYFFFNCGTRHFINLTKVPQQMGIAYAFQECSSPLRIVANLNNRLQKNISLYESYLIRQSILSGATRVRLTMDSYVDYSPNIARKQCVSFKNTLPQPQAISENFIANKKQIICVGGLKSLNKNGLVLATAFAELIHDFPDWKLIYIGKNNLSREMQLIIKKYRAFKNIFSIGTTDKIYDYYRNSEINVICSFQEGCPNTVCEAMLHGIPSIGFSDCPGTNELIRHNINGLLIDRREEIGNLKLALRALMSDQALRKKLGSQAKNDSKQFDSNLIYDKWENLLESACHYNLCPEKIFEEQLEIDAEKTILYKKLRDYFWKKYGT